MRRLLPVAALVLLLAAPVSAAPPPQQPYVVAWWSATPVLPGVFPPDVGPSDLYVAGSNLVPLALPGVGPVGSLAVAGLRFQLPPGSSATSVTLRLGGVHPPAVSLAACRALTPFAQVFGGAWADVPPYDCTAAGTARLTPAGDVVVDGVDGLRRGRAIDLVLVPGPLDRVVVAAVSLDVAAAPRTPPGARPAVTAAPVVPPAVAQPSPSALPVLGGPLAPGPSSAVPLAPVTALPPALTRSPAKAVAARPWPALLVTLLVAVAVFVVLLRPPSRDSAAGVHGVGRLRRERSGSVPDLV